MAFFGLIPSKSDTVATATSLVVVDWEYARRRTPSFDFLGDLKSPRLWLVFQRPNENELWKDLVGKHPATPLQAPATERNLSTFLTAKLAYTLGKTPTFSTVVIVGSRSVYQGLATYLTDEIGVPTRVVSAAREEERPNTPRKENEKRSRPDKPVHARSNNREERKPVSWPEADLRMYADKLAAFFQRKYTPGETYKKSYFGMAIKQATGRNSYIVFRTKNAGPFIQYLLDQGCLEAVEAQLCRVVRLPTAEEIYNLMARTTQRGPKPRSVEPGVDDFSEEAPTMLVDHSADEMLLADDLDFLDETPEVVTPKEKAAPGDPEEEIWEELS